MAENRQCYVYLPDDKKLELVLQPKFLGIDLFKICVSHFNLEESQYFGICYQNENGHISWLQQDKRVLDHDFSKKFQSFIECQFAIRFYVDSILSLKHCLSIELYFLIIKSFIYKGDFELDSETAFKLAAHALQVTCGCYSNDDTALVQLRTLPLLPPNIIRDCSKEYCEKSILDHYKELKGLSKGKSILNYLICVELLPSYGIHYYKVKDKSGLPWWLGISSKGIYQFDFHNRNHPIKTYHWRQLENLYFRDKKFLIEVKSGAHSKPASPRGKSNSEVKVCAWYGDPSLIKTIWLMSTSQHRFNLERKQEKFKSTQQDLSDLAEKLTNNKSSLITSQPTVMTKTQIKDVSVTIKKGSNGETPEMRAAKRDMCDALKARKTELEDRLYDKVQELKKCCLQEAEIIGKLPPEYVRYMDLNEKPPKLKKRVGAEYKVKLRAKDRASEREYSSVTAASSSSSGFGSEAVDPADELSQLEQELEILTQIAQAAKKLAFDPSVKGRTRTKRLRSYKRNLDKLKEVELKTNGLREKCGQEPSSRVSLLLPDDDVTFEDGALSLGGKSESEKSFISDGLTLDDDTSWSSGGDILSTQSTPAVLVGNSPSAGSEILNRRTGPPADIEITEIQTKRSLTPPPSFDRFKKSSAVHQDDDNSTHYPVLPSSSSSSGSSNLSHLQISSRNWISQKWEIPRSKPNHGWNESSLDSNADSVSITSKLSDGSRSTSSSTARRSSAQAVLTHSNAAETLSTTNKSRVRPVKVAHSSANTNQNNHNKMTKTLDKQTYHVDHTEKIGNNTRTLPGRTTSIPASQADPSRSKQDYGLTKISEHPSLESSRRRSLVDRPIQRVIVPRRNSQSETNETVPGAQTRITKSKSAQDLQPPLFDTNENIQLQYSNTRGTANPSTAPRDRYQKPSRVRARNSHPELYFSQNLPTTHPVYQPTYAPSRTFGVYYPINPAYPYPVRGVTASRHYPLDRSDYSDISLDLIPSLTEFSSRSSVCESSSAYSRKEDIKRILKDHIAMKKAPTDAGSVSVDQQEGNADFQHASNSIGKNLAGSVPAVDDSMTRRNRSHPAMQRANVFQHLPHSEFQQRHHVVPNQPHVVQYRLAASSTDNYHRPLHYRYMSEPDDKSTNQVSSNSKLTESSSAASSDETSTPFKTNSAESSLSSPGETVVVQSVRTSLDGHEMSMFKVTKSAPNTPMMKRHKRPVTRSAISSSDESDQEASDQLKVTSVQIQAALFETFAKQNEKSTSVIPAFTIDDQSKTTKPISTQAFATVGQSVKATKPVLSQSLLPSQTNLKMRQKLSQFASMPDRRFVPGKTQSSSGQSVFSTLEPTSQSDRGYHTISLHNTPHRKSKKRLPSAPAVSGFLDPVSEYIGDETNSCFPNYLQVKDNQSSQNDINRNFYFKKQNSQLYRRSHSDTWKSGSDLKPPPSVDQSIPLQFHEQTSSHFYNTAGRGRRNKAEFLKRGKLSASAEDLLWSENGNGQAGTLV